MSIRFWCARCGRSYVAPASNAGKLACCRACGHVQRIPSPAIESVDGAGAEASPPAPGRRGPVDRGKGRDRDRGWRGMMAAGAREPSAVQGFTLALVALSVADLLITHALLGRGGHFYESNPVARWFFDRWNIAGMAIYKFAIIGGVVALAEVIERHRPGWGRGVLVVGCLAAAGVAGHGLHLLLGFDAAAVAAAD